ncbi:MAG: hypothetical protein H0W66_00655 [Chthoniobacterales bacterium]|nr:hypothetical protein [Chthoniobacterales bacterium]
MKTSWAALVLIFSLAVSLPAGETSWTGNYTDKKYLNGQAVLQLNILEEKGAISVDFDAAYNDGHGCAPQASGPAQIVDKNTLRFIFTDSSNNSGTGTIRRSGEGVTISINPTRVADSKCVVFYGKDVRLGRAK